MILSMWFQGCKIAPRVGVENKHIGDTSRLDATDVTPSVDIGKVAGCRRDRLARREADPMQQSEFEMETAAGHNSIACCRASGQIFRSKLIETGIERLFMPGGRCAASSSSCAEPVYSSAAPLRRTHPNER